MPPVKTLTGSPDDLSRVVKAAYLNVALVRTMIEHGDTVGALIEIDDTLESLRPYQDR